MSDLPEKKCRDCGEVKPREEFWASVISKDGLSYYCKPCHKLRNAASKARRAARSGKDYQPRGARPQVADGQKYCPGCKKTLDVADFGRNRASYDGLTAYCRPCHNAKGKAAREKVGGSRKYHLKRRYGIDDKDVDRMLRDQEGRCQICQTELTAQTLHVDHCHTTGRVRGLLCFNCNGGLGQFKDNPEAMRRAIRYVQGRLHEEDIAGTLVSALVEIYRPKGDCMWNQTLRIAPDYTHS